MVLSTIYRREITHNQITSTHQQHPIIEYSKASVKKDLDTLFIVAGCAGAGKSTIIRSAYLLDLPLFGSDFHHKFRKTCTTPNFDECKGYSDAIKYGSIFQARHLTRLELDPSPPETLLIHIDLKGVVKRLGYDAATNSDRKRIKKRTTAPITNSQMIEPKICDLMVSSYLKNPFFKRFNKILINTIYTDFTINAKQLFGRKFLPGSTEKIADSWRNLGFKTADLAERFHREAYNSWERNLHLLKPEKIFITSVNASDSLIINNKIVCNDWTNNAKLQ